MYLQVSYFSHFILSRPTPEPTPEPTSAPVQALQTPEPTEPQTVRPVEPTLEPTGPPTCPDDPCVLGGGDGESPLVNPGCFPCVVEKVWDFDSWCWKEWDYWCVGHFVEMCQEDTGVTCSDGAAATAKELQLEIMGRNDDPRSRPTPPPYPSK